MARLNPAAEGGAPDVLSGVEQAQRELNHLYRWIVCMTAVTLVVMLIAFVTLGILTFPSLGSAARVFVSSAGLTLPRVQVPRLP